MSYRNPTIIKDDSGSVLGQAIAQGAQNIAKGIIGMEKQNQLARERKEKQLAKDKKENEERNNAIIVDAEKANKNKQEQAANIAKYAQNVDASAKEHFAELALEKDAYANQNRQNPTRENTEKMVDVMGRVNDYNMLIVNTGSMQEQALKHQQLGAATLNGNVVYPSIDGDNGENAILINNGMSAANGYGYRLEPSTKNDEKQDKLVILHPADKNGKRKETAFSHQKVKNMGPLWSLKDQNMVTNIQKNTKNSMILVQQGGKEVTNPGMLETRNVPGATANASGEIPQEPVMQNKPTGRVNDGGYYINESQLNTQLFDAQVSSQQQDTVSNIDSFQTAHDRSPYLLDLNISPEEYEKLDAKGKTQAINDSVKDIMLKTYNVREEGGNYFRETQGAKVPSTDKASKSDAELLKTYEKYNTGIDKIVALNATLGVDRAASREAARNLIYDFASLGPGASIAAGSSDDFKALGITMDDNFLVTVTRAGRGGDGEGRGDSALKFDLTNEGEAENFLRNKTGLLTSQIDPLAAALSKKLRELRAAN
jgi:hypothetical protein